MQHAGRNIGGTHTNVRAYTPVVARFRSQTHTHTHTHIQPEWLFIEYKVKQPPFFYLLAVVLTHTHTKITDK